MHSSMLGKTVLRKQVLRMTEQHAGQTAKPGTEKLAEEICYAVLP